MGKGIKMQKSDVTIEVMPDTDVEFEWKDVQAAIQDTTVSGVQWAPEFSLQEFVFGMKKLVVVCQIIDNMVPSTTIICEALLKIAGIGGAEMVNIETAANDWAKQDKQDAQAAEAKAGGGKKKKKKKAKKEVIRTIDDSMIKKAADKIIIQVKEATFYVTGIPDVDGSGQTNTTKEHFEAVMKIVREKNTEVAIMLVAAGKDEVTAYVSVPEAKQGDVNAADWLNDSVIKGEGDVASAFGQLPCDTDKDQFPIKIKDEACAQAFGFLKKVGAMKEESDDELYTFGDGADGY